MSIEKITSKIVGDAEEKKKAVLAEAKEKADEILAAAKAEAEAYLTAETEKGEAAKATLISRHKSVADIDCRKLVLAKKQEVLENVLRLLSQAWEVNMVKQMQWQLQ